MADTRLVRVDGDVQLQCFQSSETGNWVGVCEPLKLTVQSETWADLMEDFGLTLNAVLHDLFVTHELATFLKDRGWQLAGAVPSGQDDVRFDVPFLPAITGINGSPRQLHQ